MGRTLYTVEGLAKLAEITKQARKGMSYRKFQAVTGLSHATIRRIEAGEVKEPEVSTLRSLAPHTPYTLSDLIAICQGTSSAESEVRRYRLAEDVLPYIDELPDVEAAKLAQIIVARLARMEVSLGAQTGSRDGMTLHLQIMSNRQLAEVLRTVADRMDV